MIAVQAPVGFCVFGRVFSGHLPGGFVSRDLGYRAKLSGWLVAGCAVALIGGSLPSATLGQESASKAEESKTTAHKTAYKSVSKTPASKSHTTSPAKAKVQSSTSTSHAKATSRRGKPTQAASRRKGKRRTTARGQQKIDSERAQEIQEALIREHYLTGEATGSWNQASENAMRRYQADHGWQSKTVPDARALISLGLGPRHDHLLNPESAMTTGPVTPHAASLKSAPPPSAPASDSDARVAESGAPTATKTTSAPALDPPPASPPARDPSSPQ
jgi:hypothetical protein